MLHVHIIHDLLSLGESVHKIVATGSFFQGVLQRCPLQLGHTVTCGTGGPDEEEHNNSCQTRKEYMNIAAETISYICHLSRYRSQTSYVLP